MLTLGRYINGLTLPSDRDTKLITVPHVRGLFISYGFQFERLEAELLVVIAATLLISVIWKLATGSWSLGAAFGSLFVEVATLVFMRAKAS